MTARGPSWPVRLAVAAVTALAVGTVLAAGIVDRGTGAGPDPALPVTLRPDRPAPPLTGRTPAGDPVDLAALRGSVVVVSVLASWCPPCRAELPVLVDAARQWRGRGVHFVGVAMRDNDSHAAELVRAAGGQALTIVADPDATRAVSLGARGVPETFVVDRRGIMRLHAVGPVTPDWLDRSLSETATQT